MNNFGLNFFFSEISEEFCASVSETFFKIPGHFLPRIFNFRNYTARGPETRVASNTGSYASRVSANRTGRTRGKTLLLTLCEEEEERKKVRLSPHKFDYNLRPKFFLTGACKLKIHRKILMKRNRRNGGRRNEIYRNFIYDSVGGIQRAMQFIIADSLNSVAADFFFPPSLFALECRDFFKLNFEYRTMTAASRKMSDDLLTVLMTLLNFFSFFLSFCTPTVC